MKVSSLTTCGQEHVYQVLYGPLWLTAVRVRGLSPNNCFHLYM